MSLTFRSMFSKKQHIKEMKLKTTMFAQTPKLTFQLAVEIMLLTARILINSMANISTITKIKNLQSLHITQKDMKLTFQKQFTQL